MKDYQTKERKQMIQGILENDSVFSKSELVETGIKCFLSGLIVGVVTTIFICYIIIL